jgi:hypothetical protein
MAADVTDDSKCYGCQQSAIGCFRETSAGLLANYVAKEKKGVCRGPNNVKRVHNAKLPLSACLWYAGLTPCLEEELLLST